MEQLDSSQQLPVDIWQGVANHLSTREWARIRHLCRAIHDVQPTHIDMVISGASASAWLQRHWGRAVKLKLAWEQTDDMSCVVSYHAQPLFKLKHLQGSLQEESTQASTMFLAWLMGQSTRLRLISAETPTALVVPPLRTLCHLVLVADAFGDAAIAAVCQLRCLQTLKLASREDPNRQKTCFTEAASVECAELTLGSMHSLTNVALVDIYPADVVLPFRCKLHIFGNLELLAMKWCAAAMHEGQLVTLHLNFQDPIFGLIWSNAPAPAGCTITLTVAFTIPEAPIIPMEESSGMYCFLKGVDMMDVRLALVRVKEAMGRGIAELDCNRTCQLSYRHYDPWLCHCGACLECLGREQVIP